MIAFNLNYFSIAFFLGGIFAGASGVAVLLANPKQALNRVWFVFNMVLMVWAFAYGYMAAAPNSTYALYSAIGLHVLAFFIPILHLHFILDLIGKQEVWKRIIFVLYVLSTGAVPTVFANDYIVGIGTEYGFYQHSNGWVYIPFTVYFWIITLITIYVAFQAWRSARGLKKQQLKYIVIAQLFGFVGGGWTFLLTFGMPVSPYLVFLFPIFPLLIGYAIIRHHLFGIRFVVSKLFFWLGLGLFIYFSYYFVFYIYVQLFGTVFNQQAYLLGVMFTIVFIVLINPVSRQIQILADKLFYRGHNPYRDTENKLSGLKDVTTVDHLYKKLTGYLKNTHEASFVDVIVFLDEETPLADSVSGRVYDQMSLQRLQAISSVHKKVILKDDLLAYGYSHRDRGLFDILNIQVAVPFFREQSEIPLGFLFVQRSVKSAFFYEDVLLLELIRRGLNNTFLRVHQEYLTSQSFFN